MQHRFFNHKARGLLLGVAGFFCSSLLIQPLVADTGDSAPKLLSTTGGKGRAWPTIAALKKAADAGDPKACAQYGDALLNGNGVPKDTVQAIKYLRQAAAQGEANAAFRLGKIYDDGELAPKDYLRAFDYYTDAAKAGVFEAQYNLGIIYVSGHGVTRDYVEGLAWLTIATKNGAPADGEKQVRERLQNTGRLKQVAAADKRVAEIQQEIAGRANPTTASPAPSTQAPAHIDLTGSGPGKISLALPTAPKPDLGQTIENRLNVAREKSPPVNLVTPRQTIKSWPSLIQLREEADQNNPAALWALGRVYLDGTLVAADPAHALQLFEQAAAAGNADAAYQLGEMYSRDNYVPHDDAKVFAYFKQSALGKVRVGFYNLGCCYINGRGTPKNLTEGLAWLILAKKHDVDPRTEGLLRLRLGENDPAQIPLAEKRAAELEAELFPPQTTINVGK